MKKILIISLPIICLFFTSCRTSTGYSSIEDLYKAGIEAMQSKDMKTMEAFVIKCLPDKETIDYMKDIQFSYKGFPAELESHPHAIGNAAVYLSNSLYTSALHLGQKELLGNLQLVGFADDIVYSSFENEGFPEILLAEPCGLCVSQPFQDTIEFRLGTLLRINGKWKLFTKLQLQ